MSIIATGAQWYAKISIVLRLRAAVCSTSMRRRIPRNARPCPSQSRFHANCLVPHKCSDGWCARVLVGSDELRQKFRTSREITVDAFFCMLVARLMPSNVDGVTQCVFRECRDWMALKNIANSFTKIWSQLFLGGTLLAALYSESQQNRIRFSWRVFLLEFLIETLNVNGLKMSIASAFRFFSS